MNAVIKEALKEDIRYTVSMFIYIVIIALVFGAIGIAGSGNDGGNYFFYTYIAIFGVFITSAYCASKAKMDRYFAMGFSRSIFKKQGLTLGVVRSAILAVGFSALSMLGGIMTGQSGIIGVMGENEQVSPEMSLVLNIV